MSGDSEQDGNARSLKIVSYLRADDGLDGIFWRGGERWLRERGKEGKLAQISPRLEAKYQMNLTALEERAKKETR